MIETKIIFATSCDLNYLDQAWVLASSVKRIYPTSRFVLGFNELSNEFLKYIIPEDSPFDEILFDTELHPNFEQLHKKYGVIELCCSTKPSLLSKCLEKDADLVIFLDPDTYLMDTMDEILSANNDFECFLTPHLYKPGNIDMEMSTQFHGLFNLGFIALRNTSDARNYLKWWDERLQEFCYPNSTKGFFNDQSWASLAVGFLNTKIIRNPGYNYATWNLDVHDISTIDSKFLIDGKKLVFAHFSNYKFGGIEKFTIKHSISKSSPYFILLKEYTRELEKFHIEQVQISNIKISKLHYKISQKKRNYYLNLKIRIADILKKISPDLFKFLLLIKARIKYKIKSKINK